MAGRIIILGQALADRLRAVPARERAIEAIAICGVSQKELATTIGISTRMMGYLATGKRARALTYLQHLRLATRLRLDPGFLAGTTDPVGRPDRLVIPDDWRLFADAHGVPVMRLIAEAVTDYIGATESAEHGYDPETLATHDYPQVLIMPVWMMKVMWAKALIAGRRIVTADEDTPIAIYGRKDR